MFLKISYMYKLFLNYCPNKGKISQSIVACNIYLFKNNYKQYIDIMNRTTPDIKPTDTNNFEVYRSNCEQHVNILFYCTMDEAFLYIITTNTRYKS